MTKKCDDGGRGVKNDQNLRDVIYGRPYDRNELKNVWRHIWSIPQVIVDFDVSTIYRVVAPTTEVEEITRPATKETTAMIRSEPKS